MARRTQGSTIGDILEAFRGLFVEAVVDTRKEVVERGWFGRVTEGEIHGRESPAMGKVNVDVRIGSMHNEFVLAKVNEVSGPAPRGNFDQLRRQLVQERGHRPEPEKGLEHDKEKEHGLDR